MAGVAGAPNLANAVKCIKGEVHNVVSVMRLNRRWASEQRFLREVSLQSESPLLRSFKRLHNFLDSFDDLSEVDAVEYLQPFLDVVESLDTNGVITGAALSSVNKFLLYEFVSASVPRAREAANRIASAASHCRFESSSASDDEATLLRLLEVLGNCLRCGAGILLTDENVWEMVQCCFRISQLEMTSSLLKAFSETTLSQLVLTIFSRVGAPTVAPPHTGLTPARRDEQNDADDWGYDDLDSSIEGIAVVTEESKVSEEGIAGEASRESVLPASPTQARPPAVGVPQRPYGVAVRTKVLSWLAGLTDPAENDEVTRITGLRQINVVLEAGGESLGLYPSLVRVCQAEVCKFLVQNSRTDDLLVLSLTLRVVFNLFQSLKEHLKVQLEVFFTSVHLRIADSRSASDEQRELALESLLEFCREPALMLDLYINYDCDVACTNLFETLCGCLCRNAVPESSPLTSLHVLSLEGVLAVLESMARRCTTFGGRASAAAITGATTDGGVPLSPTPDAAGGVGAGGPEGEVDNDDTEWLTKSRERTAQVLEQRKQLKRRMALAAKRFNTDKKGWTKYAQSLDLLPTPADPTSVAKFLRKCPALDKELLGLYISEPEDAKHAFQTAVRTAFVATFDFRGCGIDAALRMFLESFRLPGEAQKIERLMESFAARFYEQEPGPLESADTAFILAYSIIMLNTDLHNDQVRKKMSYEQFARNNRGINDKKNLPEEYMRSIYDSIKDRQIVLQADVNSLETAAGVQWDGIMRRQTTVAGAAFTPNSIGRMSQIPAGAHEREMFKEIATPAIGAICAVFELTADEDALAKALTGFEHFAAIAAYFDMTELLNKIIVTLSKYAIRQLHVAIESPAHASLGSAQEDDDARSDGGTSATSDGEWLAQPAISRSISRTSSRLLAAVDALPTDQPLHVRRALMTIQAVFSLAVHHADGIQEGWRNVVECLLELQDLDALPHGLVEMDDFRDPNGMVLPSAARAAADKPVAVESGGLWNSVSSLLFSGEGEGSAERNPSAVEAVQHVSRRSDVKKLLARSATLNNTAIGYLVRALVQARDPLSGKEKDQSQASLCVEMLAAVALRNGNRLIFLWPFMRTHFGRILGSRDEAHLCLVERVVVSILRICFNFGEIPRSGPVIHDALAMLATMPSPVADCVSTRLAAGLALLLRTAHARTVAESWPSVMRIINNCAVVPVAAPMAWDCVARIAKSGSPLLHPQNLLQLVGFLTQFVSLDAPLTLVRGAAAADAVRAGSMAIGSSSRRSSLQNSALDAGLPTGIAAGGAAASGKTSDSAPIRDRVDFATVVRAAIEQQELKLRSQASACALRLLAEMVHALGPDWAAHAAEESADGHGAGRSPSQLASGDAAQPDVLVKFENRYFMSRDYCWLVLQNQIAARVAQVSTAASQRGGSAIVLGTQLARQCVAAVTTVVLSAPTDVPSSPDVWERCFTEVLFPLAGVRESPVEGATRSGDVEDGEYRVGLTRLLCKAFLFAGPLLAPTRGIQVYWLKLIGYLAQYLKDGALDEHGMPVPPAGLEFVFEMTLETLKNLLLVASSGGFLDGTASSTGEQELVGLTWTLLDSICPWLHDHLAPCFQVSTPAADTTHGGAAVAASGPATATDSHVSFTPEAASTIAAAAPMTSSESPKASAADAVAA